jgi:ADP-ribosyl-[dinitrogen reductase] hydrolase
MIDEESDYVNLQDRFRGCLLGLACGDALGAPLEFLSRDEIARRHGRLREMIGGGWLDTRPGEYTDDTQMMLAIARSIAERGEIDPADIAARFVDWYRTNPKDIGNTTRRAIEHLAAGTHWHDAATHASRDMAGRDASNGSLMRTAPIALFCFGDRASLIQQSLHVSRITHRNPLAMWSCVALNQAIAACLRGDPNVIGAAQEVESTRVRTAVDAVPGLARDDISSGGYVLDTLQAALWCATKHDDVEEAIAEAVNLGGDADTTGAVTGALAGARGGARALPARWLEVLEGRDELIALADRLLELTLSRP